VSLPQKSALSFLISIAPFIVVAILAYTGLFSFVENRFYNPSVAAALSREAAKDREVIQDYLFYLQDAFFSTLSSPAFAASFNGGGSGRGGEIERERIFKELQREMNGLQSLRFVDAEGHTLCFSGQEDAAFEGFVLPAGSPPKITVDRERGLLTFSFHLYESPAYDTEVCGNPQARFGSALFSLSVLAMTERLVKAGRLRVGEDIALTSEPAGIVSGSPAHYRAAILDSVSSIWSDNFTGIATFDFAPALNRSFTLASTRTSQGILYGRVVDSEAFAFPPALKPILLAAVFFTIYVIVFLLFNLKRDPQVLVAARLKSIRKTLIEHYYENETGEDRANWLREARAAGDEIKAEIKRGVKKRDFDETVDKAWDKMLSELEGAGKPEQSGTEEKPKAGEGGGSSALAGGRQDEGYAAPPAAPLARGLLARCMESRKAIRGRDGLHFVNSMLLQADSAPANAAGDVSGDEAEIKLNKDFKILVESVIRKIDYSIDAVEKNQRESASPP